MADRSSSQPAAGGASGGGRGPARRAAGWAALVVFVTVGYFQNSQPGWNVNSQFALACALAERGTFRIDAYHDAATGGALPTNDKAVFEGHFYSDKSPVTAFLGAPVVWAMRQGNLRLGWPFSYDLARYVAGWVVVGGAAAAVAALLTLLLTERGVPPRRAALGGAMWVAATPLLGYSVLFINYLPAAALTLAGAALAAPAWRGGGEEGGRMTRRLMAGGALLGLAAWTLNTHALAALVLTGLVAAGGGSGRGSMVGRLAPWAVGGAIGAAGYFVYNKIVFGSFQSTYAHEFDPFFREQMQQGLMGAGRPQPLVMALVTVHPYQGLLLWFPLTAVAVAGCVGMVMRGAAKDDGARGDRLEGAAALAVFGGLLLYVGGYFMWWGGRAYACRHLIPALALLGLGLGPWLRSARPSIWRLALGIGIAGAVANLAVVAVDPQPSPGLPLEALMHPELVARWPSPMLGLQGAFWRDGTVDGNWGGYFGLGGVWSLLPLVMIWGAAWWWLGRMDVVERGGER